MRLQLQKSSRVKCTASQKLLWMWHGNSSGI
jgi:hypothetical protein